MSQFSFSFNSLALIQFLLVCLGGAIGTGIRYLLALSLPLILGKGFPYATLSVNIVGSFLIGLIMYLSLNTAYIPQMLRFTLTTGLLGGLTTYSTFNYETLEFFREGAWKLGLLNLSLTLIVCMLAGLAGLALGAYVIRP